MAGTPRRRYGRSNRSDNGEGDAGVRDKKVKIPECSESKLVERKKIAHGVSRGETARSRSPGTGRKIAAAPSCRPLPGALPLTPWATRLRPLGGLRRKPRKQRPADGPFGDGRARDGHLRV